MTTSIQDAEASALDTYFINREKYVAIFQNLLKQPDLPKVLAFWGLNGIGKSFLLRYLYRQYQIRPISKNGVTAWLNFSPNDSLVQTPQALWYLRRQLQSANKKIEFTRFDILWATLWEHKTHLPISANKDFSAGERRSLERILDQADTIVNNVNVIPFANIITGLIRLGSRAATERGKRNVYRKVQQWFIQHAKNQGLLNLETAFETQNQRIIDEWLPRAFVADLADWSTQTGNPCLLFIDGYEVLRNQTNQQRNLALPTFVQILAEEALDLHANLSLVIASSEPLRWARVQLDNGEWIINTRSKWAEKISQDNATSFVSSQMAEYSIDYLSEADAMVYLTERRKVNIELAQTIYQLTKGYPIALSTAVDVLTKVTASTDVDLTALQVRLLNFTEFSLEWRAELESWFLHRLLDQMEQQNPSLKNLIWAAAVPRWFTEGTLSALTPGYVIQDDFRHLVNYAFVEPNIGQQSYRLHAGTRHLILHAIHDQAKRSAWEANARAWFQAMSVKNEQHRTMYLIEALYHFWHLDPLAALAELERLFEDPTISQLDTRWALLNTTSDIEASLSPQIRIQLKLRKVALYQQTFVVNEKTSENRNLALQTVEEAFLIAEQSGDQSLLAAIYSAKADVLQQLQQFNAAIIAAKQACEVAQLHEDRYSWAHALGLRATLESEDNAEFGDTTLLRQALGLFSLDQPESLTAQAKTVILFILWNQAQLALRFAQWELLEQTLPRIQTFKLDVYQQAAVNQFYGEAYIAQGRIKEAIPRLKEAQRLAQSVQFLPGNCAASGWLGLALYSEGKDKEGMKDLQEALRIEHDILHSREGVAKWLMNLAELVYLKRGDFQHAYSALKDANRLQRQLHHIHAAKTARLMETIHQQIGDAAFQKLQSETNDGEFALYLLGWEGEE